MFFLVYIFVTYTNSSITKLTKHYLKIQNSKTAASTKRTFLTTHPTTNHHHNQPPLQNTANTIHTQTYKTITSLPRP